MSAGNAQTQRAITIDFISRRKLAAPAVFFRPNTGEPDAKDALADVLTTDLGAWDGPEHNVGVRLDGGHLELGIRAGDDAFAHAFFLAAEHLRLDARAAFGVHRISSVILAVEDQELIEPWAPRWPKGFKDKHGHWTETTVKTSSAKTKSANAIYRYSKPLPGSVVPEGIVVWRPKGKAAALDAELGVEEMENRALAPTGMDTLIRALAYATLVYWIRIYLDGLKDWDSILTGRLGGWIARCEVEGRAINAQGKSLEGICWCPIDTREQALDLVSFLGKLGANADLKVAYLQAEAQLIRDPLAPVAGWPAIAGLFGNDGKQGIRCAFHAGLDLDIVEKMSERWILDLSTSVYIDRDNITKGLPLEKTHDELVRIYEKDVVFVGKKRANPFRIYSASSFRTDVARTGMFPGEDPGSILRYSPVYSIIKEEEWRSDEYKVLNTYRGFNIKPAGVIDEALMRKVVTSLDIMLGLLTRDNDAQMWWLKKFIAWTIQYPDKKQQVAPVIVGGQGIGKSVFGENVMQALFGNLCGTASAALLTDNAFLITPFIGKLITFVDEVRLETAGAINEIKKIVRQKRISGQLKFRDQQDHEIYSRLILAANHADIGLTAQDAADRALFFIVSWTARNKEMNDAEFQTWTWGYKPFYSEFTAMLETVPVRQHLMRYFRDVECSQAELEDLTHSSRFDENVVKSTMSKERKIARQIAASARIVAGNDLVAWFNIYDLRTAVLREDGQRSRLDANDVLREFEIAGVIEPMSGGHYRFKYGYGKTLQELGKAHNLELTPAHQVGPGDFDDNPVLSNVNPPPWRGNKGKGGDGRRRPFNAADSEYVDDE